MSHHILNRKIAFCGCCCTEWAISQKDFCRCSPQRSNWLKPEPSNHIFGLCVNWPTSRIISESSHHKFRCDPRGLEITKNTFITQETPRIQSLPSRKQWQRPNSLLFNELKERKGRKFLDLLILDSLPDKGLREILSESWLSLKFYQEVKNKNR